MAILIVSITFLIIFMIFLLAPFFLSGEISRQLECPYCHMEGKQKAPCSTRICRDCCKECYSLKKHCRYVDLDGQELD